MDKQTILDRSTAHVCPDKVATWSQAGVVPIMTQRRGYTFWDADGHALYDLHLNGGTFNLGHRNPDLIRALVRATEEVDIGNHHFPSAARAKLATALVGTLPGMQYAFFTSGGGEAVDVALKSARHATGRRRVVSIEQGYHGHTGLALKAGEARYAALFHSEDRAGEFTQVPFNDLGAMATALAGDDVAAVLIEPLPATFGFPLPGPDYLAGVAALCEAHGTLFVADEVQTGLGRTGSMWAVQGYGVTPDILVTGKGLSGGIYPIAAALLSERAGAWLKQDGWAHVSTFGGAELGCHVALEVLRLTGQALPRVPALAERFAEGLADTAARRPFLVEVRQRGLVCGLRFAHPEGAKLAMAMLYPKGVWALFAAHDPSVLQFKPGLLLTDAECDEILARLDAALGAFG